jgi:hypothetical protein
MTMKLYEMKIRRASDSSQLSKESREMAVGLDGAVVAVETRQGHLSTHAPELLGWRHDGMMRSSTQNTNGLYKCLLFDTND